MNAVIVGLERKTFLFASAGLMIFAAVIAFAAYAAAAGAARQAQAAAAQAAFVETAETRLGEWRAELEAIEAGASATPHQAQPMNIRLPAVLPPSPLGDFAVGAGDLHPTMAMITPWSSSAKLFSEYEFSNPSTLVFGRFDLSFFVVALLPLLMIAASFDALAGDRDRGLARMAAAQSARLSAFVWTRLILRNLFIWGVFFGIALAVALLNLAGAPFDERLGLFAVWACAAALYGLFWFALIGLAVAFVMRSESVAAILFAAWAVFVLAIPALAGAAAEALYPPPSRLAYLSEARAAEGEANREADRLTEGFLRDHPDLTVSDEEVPGYYRSTFLANLEIEKRTAPVLEAFAETRERRRRLIGRLQYLSPSLVANEALVTIAGADVERHMRFQEQARAALGDLSARVAPAVVSRNRISLAAYEEIPSFVFKEDPMRALLARLAPPFAFLAIASAGLLVLARRRLGAPLEKLL